MPESARKDYGILIPRGVSLLALFFCLLTGSAFAMGSRPPVTPPTTDNSLAITSASASSAYSKSYLASKAIDKNFSTYWRGSWGLWFRPSYWWLTLDMAKAYSLERISIFWNNTHGSTNYAIQSSLDNKAWVNLQTNLSSAGSTNKEHVLSGSYRYVRVYINKAAKTYPIIYEVKLYGTAVTDTAPPAGSIKINNGAQFTNSTNVTLSLSAQDNTGGSGLYQMQFSNDNTTWSTSENYAETKNWALAGQNGNKTVYVKYQDKASNWSQAYSAGIILDTAPPSLSINTVATPTNQNVTLFYSATDNLTSTDKITVDGNNSPYTKDGDYRVTLTAKDLAGNTSSASASFTIDKSAPTLIITSPEDGSVVEDAQVQLQGTVDGKPFSEQRALKEDANTLTKTVTDAAGNITSASVTVNLYLGLLIGPEGGDAYSPDGRVKVVIPAGALSEPKQIKILDAGKEVLETNPPGGAVLLKAVECKPYDQQFNKPVSIIYTLAQAEIPGTPVELGLYKINKGGTRTITIEATSTVPADGYTLTFSITHFSTYAALKGMISSGSPIGGGVKIPLPDMFTGAFSHAIPLTIPPGRKGMQPSLALNYRSSNGNSWVGVGFSLNPGYITRSTRLGPPSYTDDDTFYFVSDGGTTELVRLIDNLYQAKIESGFTKFYKESDGSWRVLAKDGSTLYLGQTSDSRETSSQGTFAWYLTKARDTNGNYIGYSYIKDQGKSYLSRIDYTGNENMGVSPSNSVEFFLESREDASSSYLSSSRIAALKRLKQVEAKVNSELVWTYDLEYGYSPDTGRSILKSVTQSGSDGKSLPRQTFIYQEAK